MSMSTDILAGSNGHFNTPELQGYLSFTDANKYVKTGQWEFYRVDCWGYILKRAETPVRPKTEERT